MTDGRPPRICRHCLEPILPEQCPRGFVAANRVYHVKCQSRAADRTRSLRNECRRAERGLWKWQKKPVESIWVHRKPPTEHTVRWYGRLVCEDCGRDFVGGRLAKRCVDCARKRVRQREQERTKTRTRNRRSAA